MTLLRLSLRDFRRFAEADFEFGPGVTVIAGPNGAGKTSVMEAIFFLSCGRGLRGAGQRDIIRFGCAAAEINAVFVSEGREQALRARLSKTGRCSFERGAAVMRSPRELMGLLPSVVFRPEDLDLARGGAAERRRFMDMALCQTRPRYLEALARYRRLHEGKTKILKKCSEAPSFLDLLPEYSRRLAETGALLCSFRAPFAERAAELAAGHHAAISGGRETLEAVYKTAAADPLGALAHMEERRAAELAAGQCLVGAHRDDLELRLGGRSLRDFGSQGQARTAAIALKLAARDILAAETGEPPLLLLDDVLSELDAARREYILGHIGGGQVLISSCDPGGADGGRIDLTL